jgi:ABC-type Fe3+-hydroxamate transport system substrate-binding protein
MRAARPFPAAILTAFLIAVSCGLVTLAAADVPARRVISLNPSLSAILLAIEARDVLVGVDEFTARQQPELAALPRVGGLYDPNLERVVALEPDLVVLVPSAEQRGFRERLVELGIPVLALDPVSYEDVASVVEQLGERTGHVKEAGQRASAMREMRGRVERAVAGFSAVPTLLVLQRDPLFVAGAGTFVDDMMRSVGAENLGSQVGAGATGANWPRVSREWLIASAPRVLIDTSRDPEPAVTYWARWSSIPAVASGRVFHMTGKDLTLPGPWLDRSLLNLLDLVRPGLRDEIERGPAAEPEA